MSKLYETLSEKKLVVLREVHGNAEITDPASFYEAWMKLVPSAAWFNPDAESLTVWCLNTRHRLIGMHLVAIGILDTVICHPREVFRPAIVEAAKSVIIAHNHPGGDATPSDGDITFSRSILKAGKLLAIEMLDSVVIAYPAPEDRPKYISLKEQGVLYT